MRQSTIELYRFDELSKKIRKRLIDLNRNINVNSNWYDWELEGWYMKLKDYGYMQTKIYFSGFGSQGDGACFTSLVNIKQYLCSHKLKKKFKRILYYADHISISITHNWRYCFATSTDVNIENYAWWDKKVNAQINELAAIIEKEREEIGNEIFKELENLYFYLTSDESVSETLRINEYDFMKNGFQVSI